MGPHRKFVRLGLTFFLNFLARRPIDYRRERYTTHMGNVCPVGFTYVNFLFPLEKKMISVGGSLPCGI